MPEPYIDDLAAYRALAQLDADEFDAMEDLLARLFARPAWQDDAACAEHEADLWFVERGQSTADAKQVCSSCLVRDECLAYAIEHGERHGIWGGLSWRERNRLRLSPTGDTKAA